MSVRPMYGPTNHSSTSGCGPPVTTLNGSDMSCLGTATIAVGASTSTSPIPFHLNGMPPSSDQLLLTLRSRPHCRVFRALFQYLPLRDSPNDNPQLELALNPGDVVLVKGEMDSDGFFRGETLDGRTGLVPSNYVERVPDHLILQNARAPSPSFPLSVPPHLATITHDFTDSTAETSYSNLPDSVCPFPPADVTNVTVQEIKQNDSPRVPSPRDLIVEKKLSRSLVISWSPPEESFVAVSQYHVCVDSVVRSVVPGSYKCRALIEDVNLEASVNISVRAVTDHGHSHDQACSIAVGAEAAVAPQHVRVWQITPVSACVRWNPSNSNAEHIISLNAVKVGVCPPSVFQVQLQGLSPSTIYRVSIRTKHPRAVLEQRPVERCLDFKTLPKIGLPDPPSNVQVEYGPQPGHLLISWTPVTNQPKPPSRAAVAAYLIYADGKNIAQVPQETADHVVLRLADLSDDPPIFITVRTKTREGAVSSDSNVARVPRTTNTTTGHTTSMTPRQSSKFRDPRKVPHLVRNPELTTLAGRHARCVVTSFQPLEPLIPIIDPMANSYPSYGNTVTTTGYPPGGPYISAGPLSAGAPYTAPAMLGTAQSQLQPSFVTGTMSGYGGQCGSLHRYSNYDRLQQTSLQINPTVNPALQSVLAHPLGPTTLAPNAAVIGAMGVSGLGASSLNQAIQPSQITQMLGASNFSGNGTLPPSQQATLLRTLPKYKTAAPMAQYYTFHPRLLRADGTVDEARPSVLEMENNYLLRHRQNEWAGLDVRSRMEHYARYGMRTGSADERPVTRPRLVPPRLAFVKNESGFGTRSEPDLRPPNLEDEFRWFVALYDYNHHMSPNQNAETEELSFRKHQLIKVFGDIDVDGFYHGQLGDKYGLVPSNMVIEINSTELIPRKTREMPSSAEQPSIRRTRWGSLKSRSYDTAGDGRVKDRPSYYTSLDRRGEKEAFSSRERHRRTNGRDYEHRHDDRYSSRDRERRDNYAREYPRDSRERIEDDYGDKSRYERDYDRREERPSDRREYDERRRPDYREEERHRRDRREDGYREGSAPYDAYVGQHMHNRYEQPIGVSSGIVGSSIQSQLPSQSHVQHGSANQLGQLQHQMGQMQISQMQATSAPPGQMPMMGQHGSMLPQAPTTMQGQQYSMDPSILQQRKMIAKFDYDSRQLSPNVDAEQVELSFRQGDIIIVYGEMDDDGFFTGELNGQRGLVPSNFLQSSPLTHLAPSQPMEVMPRKGVAFSQDTGQNIMPATAPTGPARKAPVRQTSQTSTTSGAASAGTARPAAKKSTAGQGSGKPLTKKMSDVGKNGPNVRKTSTAVKKGDSSSKKK